MTLPDAAAQAIDRLERAGFEAWAVGGCVRDSLMGRTPHDWDLCTAATPEQMQAVFAGERVLQTGLAHGTLTLLTGGEALEITTFRADGAYSDGRRPDAVHFVRRVEDDLARRDFTVNAMAWHPTRGLCDPFGGRADIEGGVLRAVGDAETRFAEDALRLLRAVRFAAQTGFAVEPQTAAAMERLKGQLAVVARERVRDELTRLLCARWTGRALRTHRAVIAEVLPELVPMFALEQQNPHHCYDVWEHTVRAVVEVPPVPLLRWATLLHDCGKPACKTVDEHGVGHFYGHPKVSEALAAQIAARLRFSAGFTVKLTLLVAQHDKPLGDTPKRVRRRLMQIGERRFRDLLAIKKGDACGQGSHPEDIGRLCDVERLLGQTLAENACFTLRRLAVNGNDIEALGLRGPSVGDMLARLLEAVLDDPAKNDADTLLALARRLMEEKA